MGKKGKKVANDFRISEPVKDATFSIRDAPNEPVVDPNAIALRVGMQSEPPVAAMGPLTVDEETPILGVNLVPLDDIWSQRLDLLARDQGMSRQLYVEGLIRRAWVSRPLSGKVAR